MTRLAALLFVLLAALAPLSGAAAQTSGDALEQEAIGLYLHGRPAEALVLFDRLLAERPTDDARIIWKARCLLEQARMQMESKGGEYRPLVLSAYGLLRPLGRRQAENPDWNFAVAKALWLNDRAERARRVLSKVLRLRPDFHEARLLEADMGYHEALQPPEPGRPAGDEAARWRKAFACRHGYETLLETAGMPAPLQVQALYRLGMVAETLERKPDEARRAWERAVAADPGSVYAGMARQKLQAAK
jgi:tetratricopeptide (TPR) repeat protein